MESSLVRVPRFHSGNSSFLLLGESEAGVRPSSTSPSGGRASTSIADSPLMCEMRRKCSAESTVAVTAAELRRLLTVSYMLRLSRICRESSIGTMHSTTYIASVSVSERRGR